jgi:SPP1 gp7 family putative phage head morphogenesis protein
MSKRTAEYWKKRFEALENASNTYGQQTYRLIEPAFDKAQREIQSQIEAWYGRFAKNNGITMEEARKLLTTNELKEFRWDVKEYIKYGRENDLNQAWMKELENASARVHINRLEALKIRTQHAAEVAFGNELDCIDAMARKVFTEDYYHTIYEVQKGFGIGWEIGQIDERKLETLISKPWASDGKNFSQRIWGQRSQLVDELHTQLTRTCILGKAPDDAINTIAKKFNTTKNQAGRLVMTEQAYFHSVAQQEAFEDLDVEEFEIVATLDSHTSEICQEMDGKHFPMKDYQPGVTAPPFHVWCRSLTVPWFEDNYTGERAARNEDGETYYVPDSMTYKDWKKSMVDGGIDGLQAAETVESIQKEIDDLNVKLTDKKNEVALKRKEISNVRDQKLEFEWSWKDEFKNYNDLSDSELKNRITNLDAEKVKLKERYTELEKINNRWYDKPDRGTSEYQEWKKWKNTVNFDDFYNEMIKNQDRQLEIDKEIRTILDFEDFKYRFGDATKQDFVDKIDQLKSELDSLTKECTDIQEEIRLLNAKQASLEYGFKPSNDKFFNKLISALKTNSVDYNDVKKHIKQLSDEEIISVLSGGDMTNGSCASVGLAYIGQKQGLNVLDFRGGKSQSVFANSLRLQELSEMVGMKVLKANGASSMTVANRLLKQCEIGKEYYLCVGRHAAIVRKTADDVYEYLELQSATRSGWTKFDGNPRYTLKTRFGCTNTSNMASDYDFMIDIDDSDFSTDEFKSLLGFLNTASDAQKKGTHGTIK